VKPADIERLLGLLVEANPRSVFMEVAFLESWVSARRKRGGEVQLAMIAGSLPFLERELRWKPRPDFNRIGRPAWARLAVNLSLLGLALGAGAGG
jgi:hypothetical protein